MAPGCRHFRLHIFLRIFGRHTNFHRLRLAQRGTKHKERNEQHVHIHHRGKIDRMVIFFCLPLPSLPLPLLFSCISAIIFKSYATALIVCTDHFQRGDQVVPVFPDILKRRHNGIDDRIMQ